MADYSTAGSRQGTDFELVPEGVLAKGWLLVEAANGNPVTQPKAGGGGKNSYLKCRIAITEGEYERRLVFHNIMRGPEDKALNMGNAQLRAILEYGAGASSQNPRGYQIDDDYGPLWKGDSAGIPVAIKIGIEKGKDGYKDKNVVRLFLSPNPESDGHKDFLRLQKGDTGPAKTAASAATGIPSWSKSAATPAVTPAPATSAAPTKAPASPQKPSWL